MPTHEVIDIIDGEPTFEVPLSEIWAELTVGGAVKVLTPAEHITDRQRRWYKGILLPTLAKHDENQETIGWWDTEVKRVCNGLAYLKKEIFFVEDGLGGKIGIGRLTTKNVAKKNMRLFINEILAQAIQRGWRIGPPDKDLIKE